MTSVILMRKILQPMPSGRGFPLRWTAFSGIASQIIEISAASGHNAAGNNSGSFSICSSVGYGIWVCCCRLPVSDFVYIQEPLRVSLKAVGGAPEAEKGLNWIRPQNTADWIRKAPKKNAISRCGLWRYEYAWADSNCRPTV